MSDMQAQDFMSDCRHRTSCQTAGTELHVRHAGTGLHVRHAGTGLHVRLQAQDFMSDMQAQDFMSDCRRRTSCKTVRTQHGVIGLHGEPLN